MRSILYEFFYGNISPETQFCEKGAEHDKIMGTICRNEKLLLERLNEEEKEILKKFTDAQMELNALTAVSRQVCGYKLGLLMTAEAFLTSGDLIAGS